MFSDTKAESLHALKLLQDEGILNHTDMRNALLKVFPNCAETKRSQSDPGASGGASAASAAAASTAAAASSASTAAAASSASAAAEVGGDEADGASAAKKPKTSDDAEVSLKFRLV